MALVEIKDFSALIDNRHFWSVSKKQARSAWKTYWNIIKMMIMQKEIY